MINHESASSSALNAWYVFIFDRVEKKNHNTKTTIAPIINSPIIFSLYEEPDNQEHYSNKKYHSAILQNY